MSSMVRPPGLSASRMASVLPASVGSLRCLQMSVSACLLANLRYAERASRAGVALRGDAAGGPRPPQLRRRFGASAPDVPQRSWQLTGGEESLTVAAGLGWPEGSTSCPRIRWPSTVLHTGDAWRQPGDLTIPVFDATAAAGHAASKPECRRSRTPRLLGSTTRVGARSGSLAALTLRQLTHEAEASSAGLEPEPKPGPTAGQQGGTVCA
jgi:hypothetical protein